MNKASKYVVIAAAAAAMAITTGCGGGGGGPVAVDSKFNVAWPQRSRDVNALTGALSFRMEVRGAKSNGADFIFVGNRPDTSAPVVTQYTINAAWIQSPTTIYFEFYADKNGNGKYVGGGSSAITPTSAGISVPSISVGSAITKVVVPPQSIDPNIAKDLLFTAYDAQGNVVPVSYGSAIWFTSDESLLTFDKGTARPKGTAGHVNVSAKVNDIASDLKLLPIQPLVASAAVIANQKIKINVPSNLAAAILTTSGVNASVYNSELEWISNDNSIIRFDNAVATGLKVGATKVQIAYTNPDGTRIVSPAVSVTVTN